MSCGPFDGVRLRDRVGVRLGLPQRAQRARAREEGGQPLPGGLTPREAEVLKLVAEGHTASQIAGLLVISPKTVERHRTNLLRKLGLRDRLQLARYAIRSGLVEP